MKKVIIVGGIPESLVNFRGELIAEMVRRGYQVTAISGPATEEQARRIEALGANFISFPIQRNGMNPKKDLQTFLSLRKIFDQVRPDVVLAYTVKPVIWGGMALRRMPGVKFFALISGLGFAFNPTGIIGKILSFIVVILYRMALSRATSVIFQNLDNQEEFIQRKIIERDKCYVVSGSGVNLNHFSKEPFPSTANTIFLMIARLLVDKGIREFIKAAEIVRHQFPLTKFYLVGPEDPSPNGIGIDEIRAYVKDGSIEYLGASEDVKSLYKNSHVYVLPSYHEGMPRTVLEAMATGRPILTTNAVGCRDTVINGENGFLVPVRDVEALVERMIWFIKNRKGLDSMAISSRRLAEMRFDVNKVNIDMLDILDLPKVNNEALI